MDEDDIKFAFSLDIEEFEIPGTLRIYCDRYPQYAKWFRAMAIQQARQLIYGENEGD